MATSIQPAFYYYCDKQIVYPKMTHIIAGIYDTKPFLMVDCIATNRNDPQFPKFQFLNKLHRLGSQNETYYTFTGSGFLFDAIDIFDREKFKRGVDVDYKNKETIEAIMKIFKCLFKKTKEFYKDSNFSIPEYQKIYLINNTEVYFYLISYKDKEDKFEYIFHSIPNNEQSTDVWRKSVPINISLIKSTVNKYCKTEIEKLTDHQSFKNRFSFLESDGSKLIYHSPYLDEYEMVLEYMHEDFYDENIKIG